ncbi:MAG: hypothetical protein N3F64_05570 [Nitrososphaeria archaeon]|nr:hypothetical protein [Nitrososphaeria archaeon]
MSEYFGHMLRVNLDNDKIERFTVDELTLKKFVGGTGLGIKFLYDEVSPGIEWNDPRNRLIFAAGPLNATPINGSGSVSVISKGPLTNGVGTSQANGFFGAYLRLCGLFGIIVQGKANSMKYLYIDSDSVELKDAEWLSGMNTYKTYDAIREKHGAKERQVCVASIGPAGENLVKFAGIFFDYGHSASHNGLGAVMGSKKLKAIAIKPGKNRVPIKDIRRVSEIARKLLDNVKTQYKEMYEYGTLTGIHNNAKVFQLPVKNYTTSTWSVPEDKWVKFSGAYIRKKFSLKRNNCWACQFHHCYIMNITEGPYAGEILEEPEYEQLAAWASNIGNDDITGAMILSKDVDCLGLETNEAGWVIGFAIECYQKGILTKEMLDGIELYWGNVEGVRRLLEMIAKRKGFGDILAEGVMRASRKIGGEAVNLAIHTLKGNTPRGHDHRNRWTEQFDTCTSNTGTLETWGMSPIGPTPNWEELVDSMVHDKGAMMFEDSLVTCRFNTRTNVELLCQALNAVTGWDFSWEDGMTVGKRIVHLLRAFNVRHGINHREVDRPSPRYGSVPDVGPASGRSLKDVWDKMLDRYYTKMGWDLSGKPLPDTLKKYGLDHVVKDLYEHI